MLGSSQHAVTLGISLSLLLSAIVEKQSKMKFGQNLPRNQVPEWASSYIDYKSLKKLIKTAKKAIEVGEDPDLAGMRCLAQKARAGVKT